MFGFAVKPRQNGPVSPKSAYYARSDMVEIDTTAPFQSVKAAVSLFGEVGSAKVTPVAKKTKAEERVLEKETQHHMKLRELDYYKEQLKNAEAAKVQASRDLQRANRTLQELTNKLEALSESKQASIRATEAAKIRAKELEEQQSLRAQLGIEAWKLDVDNERERYKACTGELIAAKQELANLRQDFDAALEAKLVVFQKAEDAQHTAQMNQEKQSQLMKEVSELRQTLDQLNIASRRAEEEHLKLIAEKESSLLKNKSAKEEAEKEIKHLKEEYEPTETLQGMLEETVGTIKALQEELNEIQATDLYYIKTVASELENARKKLQEVFAEEKSLRSSIDSDKLQLVEVKRERVESEKKALEAESAVEQIQAELEKKKAELEEVISKSSPEKLLAEAEKARREAEGIKKNAEVFKQEAEAARVATKEAEEKLEIALKEAEAAKAAEKIACDQIYHYQKSEDGELKDSGSIRKIRLSVEEFESMKKKIENFKSQADMKVATAMAQVENINANEKGISQKLEAILKEKEAIQSEIKNALRTAEMAEAAKRVVENELQKWRENERNEAGKSSHSS